MLNAAEELTQVFFCVNARILRSGRRAEVHYIDLQQRLRTSIPDRLGPCSDQHLLQALCLSRLEAIRRGYDNRPDYGLGRGECRRYQELRGEERGQPTPAKRR